MDSVRRYGYNPFKGSSMGFLSDDLTAKGHVTGFILSDIDLYHQPIEGPNIASFFLLLKLAVIIVGEYVNSKVLHLMKRQNGLLTEITTFLTYTLMIYCPLGVIFSTTVDFVHPINEVIGDWYCHSFSIFIDICGNLLLSHSMFCALMRYVFILHLEKVRCYGKDRAKRYFLILYVLYCLIGVAWERLEGPELSIIHNVNRCFGKDHKIFLLETSTLNVLKQRFWEYNISKIGEFYPDIIELLRCISKFLRMSIFCIMGFNVVEGILYWKMLSHMNR